MITACDEGEHLFASTGICGRCGARDPDDLSTAIGGPLAGTLEYAEGNREAEILGAVWTGALIGLVSAAAGVALGWILWG